MRYQQFKVSGEFTFGFRQIKRMIFKIGFSPESVDGESLANEV
jgi:hypothetical protein